MYVAHKDYPRLVGYSLSQYNSESLKSKENQTNVKTELQQYSTLVSADKNLKKVIIKILNNQLRFSNLKLVEWDLSACHTKILVSLFPKETPLIRKVFE